MIVGHYAAALIPRARRVHGPFWLLLLSANVPEFLWLILALAGVEVPEPGSLLDASFANLSVSMHFSHNLIPGLAQSLIVGGLVLAFFRDPRLALWCAGLVLAHILCDFVVGFEHQVLARSSPIVSLNLYAKAPYVAILIELGFSLVCVRYYETCRARHGKAMSGRRRLWLYGLFVVGILAWLPAARTPLSELLRLEPWSRLRTSSSTKLNSFRKKASILSPVCFRSSLGLNRM